MSTEPDIARDAGPLNAREAKHALDYQASLAAKHGNYGLYADLKACEDVIDQLVKEIETLRTAGGDIVRQIMASKESLTRKPQ
jgi:hypothetical protein